LKKLQSNHFYFVLADLGRVSEGIKKECNVNSFDFFLLFCLFFMEVIGGKIAINLAELR
jgi:hypothetical protein